MFFSVVSTCRYLLAPLTELAIAEMFCGETQAGVWRADKLLQRTPVLLYET